MWKSVVGLAVGVSVLFFALVGDFGPGYDELIGDFQYGERSLFFLLKWDWRYLDFAHPIPADLFVEGHRDLVPRKLETPTAHGHGAALASAMTCGLLFRLLGVLPAVDAHHTANLLFGLAMILALFVSLHRLFGAAVAWIAVVCWLGQPRLAAHAFFNIKDFPEACLFGLAVVTFWWGWTGKRDQRSETRDGKNRCWAWLTASAALWGFALSVKVNAVFLPVILVAWIAGLWLQGFGSLSRRDWKWMALYPSIGAGAFFVSWPYLWLYPSEVIEHVKFVVGRGYEGDFSNPLAPLWEWISATPEIVLVGSLAGLAFGHFERDRARRALLLLMVIWYVVPMVRANLPGMRHYDGIRHFIEVTVPAAVLAAYGWGKIGQWIVERTLKAERSGWSAVGMQAIGVMGIVAALLWPLVRVHPFELAYFNWISGGLAGAEARGHPDAGDYWAASYRRGIEWLNANAPHGSVVAVPFAEHLVALTRGSRHGLRRDLELLHVTGPFELEAGRVYRDQYERALRYGPVYVMFVTRKSWENSIIRHAREHGDAVFPDGTVDGVPVLNVVLVPRAGGPLEGP